MRFRRPVCLLALLSCPFALQAHDMGHGIAVPEEILSRPVALHGGAGPAHQPVSTKSPQAQAFYDQGLAFLHAYVWIEAARAFHQALRSDPALGMAFVGLADAQIGLGNVPAARSACDAALRLASHMSPAEQQWLTIREREVSALENPGDAGRLATYRDAVRSAASASPGDPWLQVQLGLSLEPSPFTHGQAGGERSLPAYSKALELDPHNPAALHYLVHCRENLGNIKEALELSAEYARVAYTVPHAHHMHGHELVRIGRTQEAIAEFVKTNELEESYYRRENIPAQYDWHHAHNLQLLAMSYELLGKRAAAEPLLRRAFALPASTEFLAYNRRALPEFLLDHARYTEALAAARQMTAAPWPMPRLAGHALAGEALLAMNQVAAAQQELSLAEHEASPLPASTLAALPFAAQLRAGLLLRAGQSQAGEAAYVAVEQSLLAMPGPDAWLGSVFALEQIARDARSANDWDLARYTAEQLIQRDPFYAGGHFALALVAEHNGETDGARLMFAQAAKLWSGADPSLPEMRVVRQRLGGSPGVAHGAVPR